jgi:hypothetical protein
MPAFLDDETKNSGPLPRDIGAGGESLHSLVPPRIASIAVDLDQGIGRTGRFILWLEHS